MGHERVAPESADPLRDLKAIRRAPEAAAIPLDHPCTGERQSTGARRRPPAEKLRYDLYYVKHRSLALDARILVETLAVLCAGRERARPVMAG
jgi:hypothetical protein